MLLLVDGVTSQSQIASKGSNAHSGMADLLLSYFHINNEQPFIQHLRSLVVRATEGNLDRGL
jgi:hypothetical protein